MTIKVSGRKTSKEHFKKIGFLGGGNFAVTYKVKVLVEDLINTYGSDIVAIKMPRSEEKEKALLKELVLNTTLHMRMHGMKSQHIVKYLGFDVHKYSFEDEQDTSGEEHYVMVMEYCNGGNLRKKMGKIGHQQQCEICEVVPLMIQLCEGLITIHDCGFRHRDIKPENILLSIENGQFTAKIGDLGVSKIVVSSEITSTTTGTLYYNAPEVFRGYYGISSEIYSLGMIFYEMITGELPTYRKNIEELINARIEPLPASELNPEVDRRLNSIIMKMIAKDPEKRYQAAREVRNALTNYYQGIDPENEDIERTVIDIEDMVFNSQIKQAEKAYKRLIEQYPDNPKAYLYLGEFFNSCQRHAEAVHIFEKGIAIEPIYALLYRDLALALKNLRRTPEAVDALKKALHIGLERNLEGHACNLLALWEREIA